MAESPEVKYWKDSYAQKAQEYNELQAIYKEFQQSSQDFEGELEVELAQAHAENERIRSKLAKAEAQMRKLREEMDRANSQSNNEIANLQKKVLQNGAQNDVERALLRLEQEKTELDRRLNAQIRELQEKLDASNEQNELLQTELEEIASSNVKATQELKEQLREAQAELVRNLERAGASGGPDPSRNEKYTSLVNQLKAEIQELNNMVESLTEEKVQLEARLLEESELNEELTAEVSDLTDDFMANSDKIEELESKLRQYQEMAAQGTPIAAPAPAPAPAAPEKPAAAGPAPAVVASTAAAALAATANLANMVPKEKLTSVQAEVLKLQEEKKKLQDDLRSQIELNDNLKEEIQSLSEESSSATKKLSAIEKNASDLEEKARLLDNSNLRIRELQDKVTDLTARAEEAEARCKELEEKVTTTAEKVQAQVKGTTYGLAAVVRERDDLISQVAALEEQLKQAQTEIDRAKKSLDDVLGEQQRQLENQKKLQAAKSSRESEILTKIKAAQAAGAKGGKEGAKAKLQVVKLSLQALKGSAEAANGEVASATADILTSFRTLRSSMVKISDVITSTEANYRKEQEERRKLFDSVQDMKGNIRVYCRVRPLLGREIEESQEEVLEFPGDQQIAMVKKGAKSLSADEKSFTFDRVYGPFSSQQDVYKDVEPLVLSVLDGYNVCVFAYGQTGSGKTYTMEGSPTQRGINYRAMSSMFKKIKALHPQFSYQVKVSLMEIYNEKLRDLLNAENVNAYLKDAENAVNEKDDDDDKDEPGKLKIRKGQYGMYVDNLTKITVSTVDDVMSVIALGAKNRSIGMTNMNEHSSRSHAVFVVEVDGQDNLSQNKFFGKMYLVDLAGSERNDESKATGQRLVEATYINKSLSALGDVMTALGGKKGTHVPYRNSKLTYLLQDALGGNSKTLMFVNVSPAERSHQESLCSLQFARRVRLVRLSPIASMENATFNKYRNQIEDATAEKKAAEEKLKRSMEKLEAKLREKDQTISELNDRLRNTNLKVNQVESEKKREMQALLDKQERQAKLSNEKTEREKLLKKIQQQDEKLDQLQTLLKLSQRENKTLKEAAVAKVEKAAPAGDSKVMQTKIDELSRKAREEALKRKKLEESADTSTRSIQKQLEDKDQLIRIMREKNHKLEQEMQQLKVQIKKAEVTSLMARRAPSAKTRDPSAGSPERGNLVGRKSSDNDGSVSPSGSTSGTLDDNKDRITSALKQHQQSQGSSRPTSAASTTSSKQWMNALSDIHESGVAENHSAPNSRAPSVAAHAKYREQQKRMLEKRTANRTATNEEVANANATQPDLTRQSSAPRPKWT